MKGAFCPHILVPSNSLEFGGEGGKEASAADFLQVAEEAKRSAKVEAAKDEKGEGMVARTK